jgi:hypothetical protein
MKNKNILEKDFFILKVNEPNKNFRRYSEELVKNWINSLDENGYDLEYAIGSKSKDIQYEYTNSDLVCGIITNLYIKENALYGKVKFFTEGYKSEQIYSKKINLENCVIIPKGKAEVREGAVQSNYKLFGFNLVDKTQSSFVL